MLSCKDISERASDYVGHELGRRERAMFRLHLLLCTNCRRFMRQFRAMLGALGMRPPRGLSADRVERIVTAMQERAKRDS